MSRNYTLQFWQDDGWFVGQLKEFPAVCSQGETLDELKANLADALKMMLAEHNTLPADGVTEQPVSLEV